MQRRRWATVLGLLALLATAPRTGAQEPPDTNAMIATARTTADSVLVLIDRELWDETWSMFAGMFRGQVSSAQLAMGIGQARARFGTVTRRSFTSAEYTTSLPRTPPGEYVVFVYTSETDTGTPVAETVIIKNEPGEGWMVGGYAVRPIDM